MKITCQSCQAKYTIADEKVVGKVVKIRCKKCGATIVVNGNDPAGAAPESSEVGAGLDGAKAEGWTVNVSEGDQRTMSDDEVVAAYRAGVIDNDTYCWKDGMSDWAALREIASLYEACAGRIEGGAQPAPAAASSSSDVNGAGAVAIAARRPGGRAAAADLFGAAAQAGGEDDVMTSAPVKPQAHEDQKLTGARNENSVLFSLSTLTGKSDRPPPPRSDSEASGLIDIRQLSAQLGTQDDAKKRSSRVDDIMNLSGGAFMPTLTAPVLSPPVDVGPRQTLGASVAPSARSKWLIVLAVSGGALLILAAVGGAMSLMRGKGTETPESGRGASVSSLSSGSVAVAASSGPSEGAPTPGASTVVARAAEVATAAPPAAPPAATTTQVQTPLPPSPGAQAAPPRPALGGPREPAPAPKAAAAESDQPFNMGEARARLAAVAGAVQTCKRPNGPTGTGRIVVVFAPSGSTQSASVSGDPFEGTPTGNCVAAHFRAVRVPAFAGSPFSVSKSFTIN